MDSSLCGIDRRMRHIWMAGRDVQLLEELQPHVLQPVAITFVAVIVACDMDGWQSGPCSSLWRCDRKYSNPVL